MSSGRHGIDIERQDNPDDETSPSVPKHVQDSVNLAEHYCFVCLESYSQGQYAVLVPCLRRPRSVVRKRNGKRVPHPNPGETSPCGPVYDSDCDIYHRLVDTCYQYLGRWKRWLPYYGITEVREVNFQFAGIVEPNGCYPIYMEPVNIDKILEECDQAIAKLPNNPQYFDSGELCYGGWHSDECRENSLNWDEPCIVAEAEKAKQRRKRLFFLSQFKDCARNPKKANMLNTLNGMAQNSCIYNKAGLRKSDLPVQSEEFQSTEPIRGLNFVLGWQTDRIHAELPFRISFVSFAVALVWLCVVVWKGAGGDWGTAFAFAQVVAASFAIIITYVRL